MLVAAVGDQLLGVERLRVGHQPAQLVVAQEDDVLGVGQRAGVHELAPDRDATRRRRAFVP